MAECNYICGVTFFRDGLTPECNGKTITRRLHPTGRDDFALTGQFDPCPSLC